MPDTLLDPQFDDQKLLAQVVDFYHRTLKESTEGFDYLRSRGITVGEAIDRFRIGYSNRTLGVKLPVKQVKAGKQIRTRLQQVGLYRDTGREHYAGCVVFPITAADGSGQIVDIYGRKTRNDLRKGTPLHMHLSDQHRGIWNIEAFKAGDEIILCAGLWDALTFWNAGYRNVTCTFGPDALTDDHLAAFREFNIRRVLVTAPIIAPRLLAAGLDCYLLGFPSGVDANEYARQAADPSQALGAVIRKAEWLGKGQSTAPAIVPNADMPQSFTVPEVGQHDDEDDEEMDEDDQDEPADVELEVDALDEAEAEPLADALDDDELDQSDAEPLLPATILTASPLPPAPPEIDADVDGDEVTMQLGHRRYRVRGLSKNLAFDQMKVNVLVSTEKGMYVDTFDLYLARHRRQFVSQAAIELGVEEQVVKKDLGRVLLKLEELQDEQITKMLEPKEPTPTMTPEERDEALRLLRDPNLLDRIVGDFNVVGEEVNKMVGYLAAISRKLDQPLAIIVQSSSAAGKTSLMDAVLSFVPPEDLVKYSAMTGQSLFYMGETNLKNKILAIVEEEGAERASYALKLLQSEGALTIASTGKDSTTGRMTTQEYKVEGPVALFLTTTAITIDEELLNRCLVLSVDEDRDQTKAIHQFQRRRHTLAGLLADQGRKDNRLACEVLGRSVDDLPPQTRMLLGLVDNMVTSACHEKGIDCADYRFTRRDIREYTGWGHAQLAVHLNRLQDLEYLLVHRGGRGQSFVYELLCKPSPDAQEKFLARLMDVDQLRDDYNGTFRAKGDNGRGNKPGGFRGHSGPNPASIRGRKNDTSADGESTKPLSERIVNQNAHLDREKIVTS